MKLYKCNKKVSASQITKIRVKVCNSILEIFCGCMVTDHSKEFYDTHKPIVGDYLVKGEYGDKSILRKDVFEKDYSLVEEDVQEQTNNGVDGYVVGSSDKLDIHFL